MTDMVSLIKYLYHTSNVSSTDDKKTIITKLKFLGSIKPHEKIDSRHMKIESTSILTSFKRLFFTGDSRETTLYFFTTTIERSYEIISASLHSTSISEQIFCYNLMQDLISCIKGLKAAQVTYSDDKIIVCEIEYLIEHIYAFVFQAKNNHSHIFKIKAKCDYSLLNNEEDKDING